MPVHPEYCRQNLCVYSNQDNYFSPYQNYRGNQWNSPPWGNWKLFSNDVSFIYLSFCWNIIISSLKPSHLLLFPRVANFHSRHVQVLLVCQMKRRQHGPSGSAAVWHPETFWMLKSHSEIASAAFEDFIYDFQRSRFMLSVPEWVAMLSFHRLAELTWVRRRHPHLIIVCQWFQPRGRRR